MNELVKASNGGFLGRSGASSTSMTFDNGNGSVEAVRAAKEVEGAIILAKRFPRDQEQSYQRIIQSCKRKGLAEQAQYSYPRGGQLVTGASIRLAEMLAQNWGNLNFGIKEISQENGESQVEAYCWDLETNVKQSKIFKVPHARYTKKSGMVSLTDPRDIYEMVANYGARRLRACILGVIPGDIVEAAQAECDNTLSGATGEPLIDRIRKMLVAFKDHGVNQQMIEKYLGHNIDATIESEIVKLQKIYVSLKDGMSKREDYFDLSGETKAAVDAENKAKDEKADKKIRNEIVKGFKDAAFKAQRALGYDAVELSKMLNVDSLLKVEKSPDNDFILNCTDVLMDLPKKEIQAPSEPVTPPEEQTEPIKDFIRKGSQSAHKTLDKILEQGGLSDDLMYKLSELKKEELKDGDNVLLATLVRKAKKGKTEELESFILDRAI